MKECYLCGETLVKRKNKSKDHVPPECIFPSTEPPNLITIPCCTDCNEEYGLLDEKMRNFFAILAGGNSSEVGNTAKRVMQRSPGLMEEFFSYTKPHPTLVDEAGNPRLIFFFSDVELNPWLIRVVKGLYYYRNGYRISDDATFKLNTLSELKPPSSETFPMEEGLELRPYFVYGVLENVQVGTDFWVLVFYDYFVFTVEVNFPHSSDDSIDEEAC